MKTRLLLSAAGIALLLSAPLYAQTMMNAAGGSFDNMSPGDQNIANSLFNAQTTTGSSMAPLTRDQIADLKKSEGWGEVFKQMKAERLIQARNLGQVVSGHYLPGTTGAAAASTTGASTIAASPAAAMRGRGGFTGASGRSGTGGHHFAGGFHGSYGFSRGYRGGYRPAAAGGFTRPEFGAGYGGGFGRGMGGGLGGGGHGR